MKPAACLSIWGAALAALGAVFMAWRSPHLVVDLAAYVAACF